MKKIKFLLLVMLLAPAAAFATIIGDGFTLGNGQAANPLDPLAVPYKVDLTQTTQTIVAGTNEIVDNHWLLDVMTEGTVKIAFASATLTMLNVAIDNFSVMQMPAMGPANPSGIFSLDLQPGTYNFLVTGTANSGFTADRLGIGGIYTVTTDFMVGDVNSNGVISSVPVPAAFWFMGTALFGMLVSARRK